MNFNTGRNTIKTNSKSCTLTLMRAPYVRLVGIKCPFFSQITGAWNTSQVVAGKRLQFSCLLKLWLTFVNMLWFSMSPVPYKIDCLILRSWTGIEVDRCLSIWVSEWVKMLPIPLHVAIKHGSFFLPLSRQCFIAVSLKKRMRKYAILALIGV